MNVLVAMDSLKGSISSKEANLAIKQGLQNAGSFSVRTIPIADGGEGTVEALVEATNGQYFNKMVTGPLGDPVKARYGILGNEHVAVIEIAEACGLPLLVNSEKNPLGATSYGVGELILDAIENGCNQFIVGLGGSATTDAGLGMLQALGYQFFNDDGGLVNEHGGAALTTIHHIDDSNVPDQVRECHFQVACDVTNPLYGENGAAYIFGPQKGANENEMIQLDDGLRHFASVVSQQFDCPLQMIEGAGAAGGLGAAFSSFLKGKLVPGVTLILQTIGLEETLREVDFVITGEGKLDHQTSMGKAPAGIAAIAKSHNIPVITLAGDISSALPQSGMNAFFTIVPGPMTLEQAMNTEIARKNLERTAEQIGRTVRMFS
ncbi:glycerate kinase [Oceanobacillus senegalensis]|uniref:glycerate kinase family protein n=1 Tax=Oceanobacillus senegalensis TaxID=1936063 RepID=UPI000A3045C9|nr:glycerate kinase [Oceanobacillus senegalensis]